MSTVPVQYITDNTGKQVAVILPIDFWESVFPNDETSKILSSKKMKDRLLKSLSRDNGYTMEQVHEKLGI